MLLDEEGKSTLPDPSGHSSGKKTVAKESQTSIATVKLFVSFTPTPQKRTRDLGCLPHPLERSWTAPGPKSQSIGEGTSFTSTASTHDLAAHPRANAFDELIGLVAGGHGVGRFNAGELNTWSQSEEEDESLVGQGCTASQRERQLFRG